MAKFDKTTGERLDPEESPVTEPMQQTPKLEDAEQTPAQPEPQRGNKRRNR